MSSSRRQSTGARPVIALTAYPLSRDFRARMESRLADPPDYLTLAELRQLSLGGMLRALWRTRADTMLLPMEDRAHTAILPLLATLAALTRSRRIEIVEPDLARIRCSRARAAAWLLKAGWASLVGLLTAFTCHVELARLLASRRHEPSSGDGGVLYLKTNLWMGVKAGGSVGHIAGVVNGLVRKGLAVVFLSAEAPIMVDPSVDYHRVALPSVFGLPRDVNQYVFHRRFVRRALGVAATIRARFIYQRLSIGNYAGVLLSRRLGIPLVLEYNGSEAWVAKNWGYRLSLPRLAVRAEEACLRHAHLLVTVSDVLRDELVERGIEPARIVTYPNCVDPEVFDSRRFSPRALADLRAEYGIPTDALVVTFIGTFGRWHGAEVFARAIARLVDREEDWLRRHRVRFLLVGDGLRRPDVEATLAAERQRDYVSLPGLVPQDQAPLHLAASDVLVSPHVPNEDGTRFFGSPTKLFEYLAMGRAIVASDLDQIGQVLAGSPRAEALAARPHLPDDGVAVLTEPGDADELATAIRLLAEHPDWRRRLGERARALAVSRYTWDRHVAAILDGLDAAALSSPPTPSPAAVAKRPPPAGSSEPRAAD